MYVQTVDRYRRDLSKLQEFLKEKFGEEVFRETIKITLRNDYFVLTIPRRLTESEMEELDEATIWEESD